MGRAKSVCSCHLSERAAGDVAPLRRYVLTLDPGRPGVGGASATRCWVAVNKSNITRTMPKNSQNSNQVPSTRPLAHPRPPWKNSAVRVRTDPVWWIGAMTELGWGSAVGAGLGRVPCAAFPNDMRRMQQQSQSTSPRGLRSPAMTGCLWETKACSRSMWRRADDRHGYYEY